jgi:hypothetical protein
MRVRSKGRIQEEKGRMSTLRNEAHFPSLVQKLIMETFEST